MSNSNHTPRNAFHLLSLIPLGIAVGLFSGALQPQSIDIENMIIAVAFMGLLYGVTIYLAESVHSTQWLGYVHVSTSIMLLTVGLANALYIIIGVVIGVVALRYIIYQRKNNVPFPWQNITGWMSLSGITVIAEYFIYTQLLNQSLPFLDLTVDSLFWAVVALSIGMAISVFIGSVISQQPFVKSTHQTISNHPPYVELLLTFVAVIIAVTLYQVNVLTFVIIISFTTAQVIYEDRRQKLKQESQKQLQDLSTLNSVAQAVSVNLKLEDVLYSIYHEVNQIVNASVIFVALYDKELEQLTYPLIVEEGKRIPHPQKPLAQDLTDYVIRNKQILQIQKSDTIRLQEFGIAPNTIEAQAYVGIPIMIGERILGVMGILNYTDTNILDSANLNILQSIVNQASLVIRNATLYDRTTQFAVNLSLINQSVQDVMFNLDQQEALRAAVKTAKTVVKADQVAILLLNTKDVIEIKLAQTLDVIPSFKSKLEMAQPDWFITNQDSYRIVHDLQKLEDEPISEWAAGGNICSYAEIPMRSGNAIVGYLLVFHAQRHNYHTLEIDLLEMLASQITVALDNADLLQALELYASEQAELVHLSNISAASLELEKVITDVSLQLRKMLKADQVEIGLYVAGQDHIHIYTPHQNGHLDVHEYNLSIYPEFHIRNNAIIHYPKIMSASDADLSATMSQYMNNANYKTLTFSPMVINGEVIGVIIIGDTRIRLFKDNERRLIEMSTTQIAAQIHNTQIHTLTEEALVQRLEQLSLIEDIGQKISRSLDLDLIINNVLEAAIRSTQADIASIALKKDESTVSIKQHKQLGAETIISTYDWPLTSGVIGKVMETGVLRVINDNRLIREYETPADNGAYLSSIVVPLTKGDKVIGVLNVESTHLNFFTDEHTGFVKSLAGHAVISIDNANLLDEHQKQIQVLSQLRELALTAFTTTSTNEIIQTIIQTAIEMLSGSGGILIPFDADNNSLSISSTLGWIRLGSNFVQDVFFIPEQLLYQVCHTEEAAIIEDVHAQDRYKSYEQKQQVTYTSIVIIPIKRRNHVTELLCITFNTRRAYSKQDHNTIQLLQVQIANHIENVRLSEEIRASNVRMRAILDSTRDGIILLDRAANLQDANISAEDLLGIELSNYRNENFATILVNRAYPANQEENFADLIETARILQTEPERNMIREYTLRSGKKTIYIREVSSPVWDSSNEIIGRLLSLRDVSEERAMEEFRVRLQSMIVHDLKSPLSAIITSMILGDDLLTELEDSKIVEDLGQLMHVAHESSSNLLDLVESMLDIGKLQRKQMEIKSAPNSIKEIAETAYTTLLASFKHADIKMTYDIPDYIGDAYVDEALIRRVFVNLIQNALKFTPTGGEIRVTARLNSTRDDLMEISVSDTGHGIPEEHRHRIFGEFTTIEDKDQKQQRGPRGQGLGLTFCKLTIEAHSGKIWIADEGPLPGATFVFTLPMMI